MQIVIPMSGIGQRFLDAGFNEPKPLIAVDGKPVIEHIVNMFPGETNFIFICNSEHLQSTSMRETLERIAPQGKIIEVAPHKKGPVYAVSQAFDHIDNNQEVIINYCDFCVYWKYEEFLSHTRNRKADGAVVAYRGFHPHMLGSTNYAFMREKDQWMLEIKEKEPFTNNRMTEFASTGTYYFKSGKVMKETFIALMEMNHNLKGEYYVSLAFNLLVEKNYPVSIYEVQHMLQWGEPGDLNDYNMWSEYFRFASDRKTIHGSVLDLDVIIPMAGLGSRFTQEGQNIVKPLIEVAGKPMVVQAAQAAPEGKNYIFICLKEHLEKFKLHKVLDSFFPTSQLVELNEITDGQASSAEIGVHKLKEGRPFLILPCDSGIFLNQHEDMILSSGSDIIAFTFRATGSALKNPQMYGWIRSQQGKITEVSVKKPFKISVATDEVITGAFYFKDKKIFQKCLDHLRSKQIKINNEFYIDSFLKAAMELGLSAKSHVIDHFLCWGTPAELKSFEYWQSFFHKCSWHPYQIETDPMIPSEKHNELKKRFSNFKQGESR